MAEPALLRIPIRRFMQYSTDQLHELLEGDFIVVADDGEIVTNERETIYSRYVWRYFEEFPNTPMLVKHHVRGMLGKKELRANAHLQLINAVLWNVHDAYVETYAVATDLRDRLAKMAYEITNTMYNDLSLRCEEYVTSLDITDFTAITTDARLEEAIEKMPSTEEGIASVHALIRDMVDKDPKFVDNPLAITIRTGVARMGQALQCLGPRGYLTDMDSNNFRYPITTGYVQGNRTLYGSMIESRSAAKSLINSTKPLQDSEYFSRRQQLICQNVKHLHPGDCGSQNYLPWRVRGEIKEGITTVYEGDLPIIAGKYYLDESTNTLKVVKESDTELIGKLLKLRSPVAGCCHPDPYGICEVCYGEGALAIPARSNLGHIACVSMTALIGQLILSTKHYDGSSIVEGIVLKPLEKKYLDSDLNGNSYRFNDKLKGKKIKLQILTDWVPGLPDIKIVPNVEDLNVTRVSEFQTVFINVIDPKTGNDDPAALSVHVAARNSSMTHDLLRHIKEHGFRTLDNGNYEFDMTGWDFSKPLFVLPMSQYNMADHRSEIASMLEATAAKLEERNSHISPMDMLGSFNDLVNRRLAVSLSVLEVILYSSMVVNALENNYDLPKPWTKSGVGVMRLLLSNRSLSAQMGFQNHHNTLADPASYVERKRMNHVFDGVIMPELFNGPYKYQRET